MNPGLIYKAIEAALNHPADALLASAPAVELRAATDVSGYDMPECVMAASLSGFSESAANLTAQLQMDFILSLPATDYTRAEAEQAFSELIGRVRALDIDKLNNTAESGVSFYFFRIDSVPAPTSDEALRVQTLSCTGAVQF